MTPRLLARWPNCDGFRYFRVRHEECVRDFEAKIQWWKRIVGRRAELRYPLPCRPKKWFSPYPFEKISYLVQNAQKSANIVNIAKYGRKKVKTV
jgi:hypothetical protein